MERMQELASSEYPNAFVPHELAYSFEDLDPDLSDYIVSFAFGDIYSRENLTQQEQTMVTIASLAVLGAEPQLKMHINVGLNVGLTEQKIAGILIQQIPYIGFPRILNALKLLRQALAERTDSSPGA